MHKNAFNAKAFAELCKVCGFVARCRVCFYNIAEADTTEAKMSKAFSYTLDGKTLTTLTVSAGTIETSQ